MFNKKKKLKVKPELMFKRMSLSFVPEEIISVMSDVVVDMDITDSEYITLMELIDKYGNDIPKIKVVLNSESNGVITLTNLKLDYCGVPQ